MSEGRSAIAVIMDPQNRPAVKTVLGRLQQDIEAESKQHNVNPTEIELCVWVTLGRILVKSGVPESVLHGLVEFTSRMPDAEMKEAA